MNACEIPWTSSDGTVRAVLYVADPVDADACSILEWSSTRPGQGRTEAALRELRCVYGHVHVNGIGRGPDDPSWTYWMHMARKGLVDSLEDDEGRPVVMPQDDRSQGRSR